ncbi:unnamed protein product [Sphagnum tenellum]
MTSRMLAELGSIPTKEQREAVVAELLQSFVRVASLLVTRQEVTEGAWRDLGDQAGGHGREGVLAGAGRRAGGGGGLARRANEEEEEVTIASANICEY